MSLLEEDLPIIYDLVNVKARAGAVVHLRLEGEYLGLVQCLEPKEDQADPEVRVNFNVYRYHEDPWLDKLDMPVTMLETSIMRKHSDGYFIFDIRACHETE
jgi:hypothetical protein